MIVADLDHFKAINDTFGHRAGDDVLRTVGEVFVKECRQMDRAFRVGGEEFAIIGPQATAAMACALAERIRLGTTAALSQRPHAVTVSLGVATYPDNATDPATLIEAADQCCYTAKAHGRNRTMSVPTVPRQGTGQRVDALL